MAIPTTASSAQLLLILSFLFLGIWPSTFKLAGNRWRFELFSFDFALGGVLFALLSSYTLGTFGADLGFNEHLMISSRTSQAFAVGAGALFAFGSMLLLLATALLGASFACAIAAACALFVLGALEFDPVRVTFLGAAGVAALLALIFQITGARRAEETLPAVSIPVMVRKSASGRTLKPKRDVGMLNSSKGVIAAIFAGLALGGLAGPLRSSVFGQFGLGAFAGLLLFYAGAVAATVLLNLYFMNLAVHGGSIGIGLYFRGGLGQHLLGLIGGAVCAAGILSLLVLNTFPVETQPDPLVLWGAGLFAALFASLLGVIVWGELRRAAGSAIRFFLLGTVFLAAALGAFAWAMDKTPAPPPPASTDTQPPG